MKLIIFFINDYRASIIAFIMVLVLNSTIAFAQYKVEVYETSATGNSLKKVTQFINSNSSIDLDINPNQKFQTITGFGGAFTESSAYLLSKLSLKNKEKILKAYFSTEGANYSLTRTHIGSCDFSLSNYAYANIPDDKKLDHFSIEHDRSYLIPMIKDAQRFSKKGFKIVSSPWTAPPWMKDNNDWRGGKLLPEFRETWALYFSRYIKAYKKEGITIWGVTVENEPLGNGNNWESMNFTPQEMSKFVCNYLGPHLDKEGLASVHILGYDQNRGDELSAWAKSMFTTDSLTSKYFGGTAVHWYASTYNCFPASLQYTHHISKGKYLINTEACIDATVPVWKDDSWYWRKQAKDWGWTWAPEKEKYLHPEYVPVHRYASDIIGCLNNYVDGWIDWNMVLDKQGGPNWAKNWCTAPVIVDVEKDEVYFTPLYYTMAHLSKFIRPGAVRIGCVINNNQLMATAVKNLDESIIVVVFNPTNEDQSLKIKMNNYTKNISITANALQTIVIKF